MSRTSTFELVNKLTHGRLERRLVELRADGLSFELMAERIRAEFDIPTSTMTVRRWWGLIESETTPLPRRKPRRAS